MTKKRTLDDIPDRGKDKKWEDDLKFLDLPNGDYVTVRIVGSVLPFAKHWIEFISKKTGKRSTFPVDCPRFNPDTEEFDRPILDPKTKEPLTDKKGRVKLVPCACCDAQIKASPACLLWVIDYRLVEDGNPNPVRALRIPLGVVRDIKAMKQLNKVKNKKTGKPEPVSVMHEKHGCQISIKYDDSAKGPSKWSLSKGERLPLTSSEVKIVEKLRDFDDILVFPEQGKVIGDLKRHGYLNEDGTINTERESLDPRDGERDGRKAPSPKGKRASVSSEESSEEESEKPTKTKKGKKPTSSEDEPAPKKGKKGKNSSEDDSEAASSEEDSEKPAKGKKTPAKGKKDDSEEDDSEDSEDLPDPKKGKAVGKNASKDSSEDSEEDDSEADSSEEDSEEPAPKKGKKGKNSSEASEKPAKKGKKKFDSSED
jgi:hypothetical protein